ncbi:phage portal protein [Craterilacuibacter sp. RT1T]|uniref:phage portal protein n=1 Tax=Craterilacuibacter sp. RT1T TaxID=2942211 RepID=UPI0020C03D3C|nr:phage portal protein [Craterilacuibacter sp. RT1T]MCL6262193.1 phage portal protein [Craterilacuibacter sp. RT1T]
MTDTATPHGPMAFSFGDPEPVLSNRGLLDYLHCTTFGGRWYEPPVSLDGLAQSFRASVHHGSALYVKRNVLASTFRPHPLLSRAGFSRLALDFLIFGNAYLERRTNQGGRTIELAPAPAKYMRRGLESDTYWYCGSSTDGVAMPRGSVYHLMEYDVNQELYGMPEYLAALNSAWLNESATLFRRKYFQNGSHAGFILYMTDTVQQEGDVDALRKALKDSKGPGNFRNLFVYAPGGKKDGIQLLPVSEVAAKDDFSGIKNITRDDQLAMHRVPPQLLGVMPGNVGGFGDVEKAAKVFWVNEIKPLQARFAELNDWLGEEVVRFDDYALADPA